MSFGFSHLLHPFANQHKTWKSSIRWQGSVREDISLFPPHLRLRMVLRHWSLNSCIAQKCQAGTEGAGNHSDIQTQRSYAHLKIYAKLMEQIRRSPLGMYKTLWKMGSSGYWLAQGFFHQQSVSFSTKESMRSSGTFLLWDKNSRCGKKYWGKTLFGENMGYTSLYHDVSKCQWPTCFYIS